MSRRAFPSFAAVLLPALLVGGCGESSPPPAPALTAAALQAVAKDPGVDREKLARAVDAVFTREGIGETRAVIVMHGGEIVAERYAEGYGPDTRFVGWSMSKTVTGVLIGMLVSDGRLRLDDSPPIPRWRRAGDPRGEITLRELLQMRSGLRHEEKAEPVYIVRAKLDRNSVNAFGRDRALLPGMTLSARITTEHRTLLEWLFEPLYAVGRR